MWSWFKGKEEAAHEAALDAAVRAAGKPATALVVGKEMPAGHVFPATATHFGGEPYFESGDTWPTTKSGDPYDFVCQVDLRDCVHRPAVPFDLFTVFFCWALEGRVESEACLVRTYRAAAVSKAIRIERPPRRSNGDYRVRPCPVRSEAIMTYPWSMKRFPGITAAASSFRDPEAAYSSSLKRVWPGDRFGSRVGGYATWVHDNTLEDDDFFLLAQIDFEPPAKNCIGDAAPIFIAVSTSDPTRIETDTFQTF